VRALVLGAAGQLGRELVAKLGGELAWAGGRADLDVTDSAGALALFERVRPEVVFNATAYNKVDAAESDRARAFGVNAEAPGALAHAARRAGARLVHVSTDYVFDGASRRPYREGDPENPLSVYGASKLEGERRVLDADGEALVVRTSGVLGRGGSLQKGGSFVERIVARARAGEPLRVVGDQVFAPTIASDLAAALVELVRRGARGLVHVTSSGSCSWHELAVAALAAAGVERPVEAITTESLRLPARRPAYSVLDCSRAASLGVPPARSWRDALPELVAVSGAAATAGR
jgi:dTDP-4-dehydrorhamnose reductase